MLYLVIVTPVKTAGANTAKFKQKIVETS